MQLLRRAAVVSVALHLVGAAPFVIRAVLPPAVVPDPVEPVMAQIELIQQDTPTVGDNPPPPAEVDQPTPAATTPAASPEAPALPPAAPGEQAEAAAAPVIAPPPQPAPPAPRDQLAAPSTPAANASFEPAIRLGEIGEAGTGLVSGPAVIPATLDSKVHNKPPAYPPDAARRGEEGVVVLLVQIAPDGSASAVDVQESSGYEVLDRAAQGAVARWHFRPPVEDGAPVAGTMEVDVHFAIRGKAGWSGSTGW